MINKYTSEHIRDLTYDKQIIEIDDRIIGYITRNDLRTWMLIDNIYYTDDVDFCDKKMSEKHGITVQELRSLRVKDKQKINSYFTKNKKISNKKEQLLDIIKKGINLNNT